MTPKRKIVIESDGNDTQFLSGKREELSTIRANKYINVEVAAHLKIIKSDEDGSVQDQLPLYKANSTA